MLLNVHRSIGQRVPKYIFLSLTLNWNLDNSNYTTFQFRARVLEPNNQHEANSKGGDQWLDWAHDIYEKLPGLKDLRNSSIFKDMEVAYSGIQEGARPAPVSRHPLRGHAGVAIMSAILRQFIQESIHFLCGHIPDPHAGLLRYRNGANISTIV